MSDSLEKQFEYLDERLKIIETKLDVLINNLPQDQIDATNESIKYVRLAAWERRMGEDL